MKQALAISAILLGVWAGAFAQAPKGIPRTANGKPDFSGVYEWPKAPNGPRGKGSATIFDRAKFAPFKKGGEAFLEPRTGVMSHDEPRDFCMPAGFPANMLSANALQMVQNKDYLSIVHEFQRTVRLIPLDGRPHRTGIEPTYYGDPVGKWDGDTLVIDSTNFKRWALDDYYYTDPKEYRMHSDALHTIEKIRYKNATTLTYDLTIDDPKIFTAPWSQEFEMSSKPEWDKDGLYEYVCEENNRCPGGHCSGN